VTRFVLVTAPSSPVLTLALPSPLAPSQRARRFHLVPVRAHTESRSGVGGEASDPYEGVSPAALDCRLGMLAPGVAPVHGSAHAPSVVVNPPPPSGACKASAAPGPHAESFAHGTGLLRTIVALAH
jgi:hypothetical protein